MNIVKLDPERKRLLVEALRAGEYQQAHRALTDGTGYCCYGVACKLAEAPLTVVDNRRYFGKGGVDARYDNLPKSVSAWLGISTESYRDGRIYIPIYESDPEDLQGMSSFGLSDKDVALDTLNDALDDDEKPMFPFERIAALIEERL